MTVTKETKSKQKKCFWSKEEKETSKEVYGTEILIENGEVVLDD